MSSSLVGSWVDRAKTKLLVEQATSTDDEPTPIYVLDEVVAALAGGDTRAGVDAVVVRLAHRSPVVKQKALKLLAHIGRRGSPDLRRLLARQSGAVRDLLHYRCDPDPFKGDSVWRRVQQYAQEALSAIHTDPEAAAPTQNSLGGRIQGFGSDAAVGGGSGGMQGFGSDTAGSGGGAGEGGSSGSRMVGFGNADVVHSGMQAVSSSMRSLRGKAGGLLRQDGYSASHLDGGSTYCGGSGRQAAALYQPIMQAGALALAASSSAGPAAGGGGQAGGSGRRYAAAGGTEQRLVDRICAPGGLRAAAGREDLHAFVDAISPLDGSAVAHLLERKLEAGPWQSKLRALCAIEAVAEVGSSTAAGQVVVHFQARPDAVRRAAQSPQASVHQRAQKLLTLLGADGGNGDGDGSASVAACPGQQQQQQLFAEDLLGEAEPAAATPTASSSRAAMMVAGLADLLGDPATPAPPSSSASAAFADPHLLAGLDAAPSAAAGSTAVAPQPGLVNVGGSTAAPAAADPFCGMLLLGQQPAAPAAATPAPPGAASPLDLLGGLSLQGAPTPPTTAAVAPQAAAVPGGGLGDLLGGLSLGPAAAAPMRGSGGSTAFQMQSMQQLLGGSMAASAAPLGGPSLGTHASMHALFPGQLAGQQAAPFGQQAAVYQTGSCCSGQMGHALPLGTASGMQQVPLGRLGSGSTVHGRQPSLNSDALSMLNSSGIIDSPNSFNFVEDAIAAARRKK